MGHFQHAGKVLFLLLASPAGLLAADIDAQPLQYTKSTPANCITRLEKRIADGKTTLHPDKQFGYLRPLLTELGVPESSQVLVFSKTSLQRHRIGPSTPRALYFNDSVHVGFCQNGDVLEISTADPQLGTVFYTLDQKNPDRVQLTRQTDACMLCHASSYNEGFPGHVLRSVYSDRRGYPILSSGTFRIDHTSPLKQRWGGWYVTGKSGSQTHLGNLIVEGGKTPEEIDNKDGVNVTDLSAFIRPSSYLTPHSDLVALMVLEHQAQMHNHLVRANFLTRLALYDEVELRKALGERDSAHSESTLRRIKNAGEPLVKTLLFSEEAALTGRLQGTSPFAKEFTRRGPFDKKGRSFRDFDLEKRLFTFPCSYLIYSESMDTLPLEVKDYVYRRLWEILAGKDTSKDYAHLTPADRQAIREILQETKRDLPDYWRK